MDVRPPLLHPRVARSDSLRAPITLPGGFNPLPKKYARTDANTGERLAGARNLRPDQAPPPFVHRYTSGGAEFTHSIRSGQRFSSVQERPHYGLAGDPSFSYSGSVSSGSQLSHSHPEADASSHIPHVARNDKALPIATTEDTAVMPAPNAKLRQILLAAFCMIRSRCILATNLESIAAAKFLNMHMAKSLHEPGQRDAIIPSIIHTVTIMMTDEHWQYYGNLSRRDGFALEVHNRLADGSVGLDQYTNSAGPHARVFDIFKEIQDRGQTLEELHHALVKDFRGYWIGWGVKDDGPFIGDAAK